MGVLLEEWTIVEPGMYLCAACLVGLRPLFIRRVGRSGPLPTTFGLSSFRGHITRPSAAHFKNPGFNELESTSNLANLDSTLEEGKAPGIRNQFSRTSLSDGQIRVHTEIEVKSEEGSAAVYGFNFS